MTIISELVLVDYEEAVLLDAEELLHLDAGEPVPVGLDTLASTRRPRFWSRVNVEACKIIELFRELRADPTSYSESVPSLKMTIFPSPASPSSFFLTMETLYCLTRKASFFLTLESPYCLSRYYNQIKYTYINDFLTLLSANFAQ